MEKNVVITTNVFTVSTIANVNQNTFETTHKIQATTATQLFEEQHALKCMMTYQCNWLLMG